MLVEKTDPIKWDRLVSNQVVLWDIRHRRKTSAESLEGPWSKKIVTISRTHGAGADPIARELGKLLNWPVYDKELVEYIAKTAKIRERVIASFDERKQNEMENWVQTIIDKSTIATDKYFKHLLSVFFTIFEHGHAIAIGRGGNYVTRPDIGFRVLITAPLFWRANRLAEERKVSLKQAQSIIRKVDNQRAAFIHRYYHCDPNDHAAYDIVVNVERLGKEKAAKMIFSALEQWVGHPYPK